MCEMCCRNAISKFEPTRRGLLHTAAVTMGLLLANAAGAKEMKAPPKPQNVLSPDASLERVEQRKLRVVGGIYRLGNGRVDMVS